MYCYEYDTRIDRLRPHTPEMMAWAKETVAPLLEKLSAEMDRLAEEKDLAEKLRKIVFG